MRDILFDIRLAFRRLRRRPGYAVIAATALGIGIGATTSIFSIVDALLLRPFAFPSSDSLVTIWATKNGDRAGLSPADFRAWRSQDRLFEHLAAYRWWDANLTAGGAPEKLSACQVSVNFFRTLGAEMGAGRDFVRDEDRPGEERTVILSYGLWQSHFAGDPRVLGSTIHLNDRVFTVVGVAPAHLEWPLGTDLWAPLALTTPESYGRMEHSLMVLGRLRRGITLAEARAEGGVIARRLEQEFPETNTGWGAKLTPLRDQDPETEAMIQSFLAVLFGAAAFVLLIACANVANFQLAVATRRQTETAVRSALGAGRWRVIRELLTESVVVGLLGGAVGALLACWGVYLIKVNLPSEQAKYIPGFSQMHLNARGLEFALLVAFLAGILSGLGPASSASRFDLNEALKGGGRSLSGSRRSVWMRSALVVSEVALAVVLLTATGLMVRGFVGLFNGPAEEFEPKSLLTLRVALPKHRYPDQLQRASFYTAALRAVRSASKIRSVGLVSYLPMSGDWDTTTFCVEGRAVTQRAERLMADLESVSPDYFSTMGIPLVAGRVFSPGEGKSSPPAALVSESLARQFWPDRDPLGHRIKLGSCHDPGPWRTILGVVGDVRQFALDKQPRRTIYVPYVQLAPPSVSLVVRDGRHPTGMAPEIRSLLASLDPEQTAFTVKPMDEVISDSVAGIGMAAALVGSFGIVALILAAVGIYGLVSYSVSERTEEFGVRMALGARPVDIQRLVVLQALKLGLLGLACGLPGAMILGRLMTSVLFGLPMLDPRNVLGVALALLATALCSGYLPALRASRVSPLQALRRSN